MDRIELREKFGNILSEKIVNNQSIYFISDRIGIHRVIDCDGHILYESSTYFETRVIYDRIREQSEIHE